MAGETIDSLTVDVGLTSGEFQAGVDKILGAMGEMRVNAAATGESMTASIGEIGGSIGNLALKFTGLFLAVRGIEDVVGYFKDLSLELGNLGFEARYLGQSGTELSRWGEVARLAGGNAQDAVNAVQGLQQSIFGLEFQGQISQNLLQLQRLGVGYLNAAGQMRPLKDIALDTAAALQKILPGQANQAMRVQWAAQIFGPGGLANAVGGGLTELRKFYAESAHDQKNITQRVIDSQMRLRQDLTRLSYEVKSEASIVLERLTPAIEHLIGTIESSLIPTLDEEISDVMDLLHPGRAIDKMVNKAMGGAGVGSLWNPIHAFEAIGIGLGIRAGQFHDWWEKELKLYRTDKLAQITSGITVPAEVNARLPPGSNMDALKLLWLQNGGEQGDPTWSKAITEYLGMGAPGAAALISGFVNQGKIVSPRSLSTPGAARPAVAGSTAHGKPTAATGGPRVQIGTIGPIYTQAKDAHGLMADVNRAAERKLLVSLADPGLA